MKDGRILLSNIQTAEKEGAFKAGIVEWNQRECWHAKFKCISLLG